MDYHSDTISTIKSRIEEKIARDQVILPTIPDSLVRIRKTLNDETASIGAIANVLGADPTLAAKILKVSNSASFHRNGKTIENLQQAVTRLGNKLVQTLTVNHALIQIFAKPKGISGQWVNMVQNHSINIAAQAYALAKHYTRLNPDDILLAGLLHNIGYLPLLQLSEDLPDITDVENPYWQAIRELQPDIGAQLLKRWNFPDSVINAAKEHANLIRNPSPVADVVDVIIVAQLTLPHIPAALQYSKVPQLIPAYAKLGLFSPTLISENEQLKMDFVKAYELLSA